MLMHAFPQQMYFVASEHLLRRGFGRPMALLMDPIIRQKGRTDADAALAILRRLRQGKHVCVFIEGERSYDGCTAQIAESAAHLAKLAGVTFVTYRLENAYFSGPRWARHVRRGPVSGDIRHIYSPQELAGLSRDALQQALCRDLWLDASAEQAARPAVYRGRRLAEYLETTLFLCPRCGRIGSLKSADDRFACSCGLALRYTEYGRLEAAEGGEPPFTTVRDWFAWQRDRVQELARAALLPGAPDAPLIPTISLGSMLSPPSRAASAPGPPPGTPPGGSAPSANRVPCSQRSSYRRRPGPLCPGCTPARRWGPGDGSARRG